MFIEGEMCGEDGALEMVAAGATWMMDVDATGSGAAVLVARMAKYHRL